MANVNKGRLNAELRKSYEHRSGLDALRQFIPDANYNDSLIEHVSKSLPEIEIDADRPDVREHMVDKATAILTYLRDNGYDFSVQTDRDGQLKAKLSDVDMSIRLLDTDKNSDYVGRVYSNGVTYYFSEQDAYKAGADKAGNNLGESITPQMAVDLVRYALGESVNRVSSRSAGASVSIEPVGSFDKDAKPNRVSSYHSKSAFTTLYATWDGQSNINIRCDFGNLSKKSLTFAGDDALMNAEEFVSASRSNAVANFKEFFKADAVDELAKRRALNEFETMPEFSDNKIVADLQKEFYLQRLDVYKNTDKYSDEGLRSDAIMAQNMELQDKIENLFGNPALHTINPVNIAAYMDSSEGFLSNERNLSAALRVIQNHGNAYEIMGDDFADRVFKEKLIAYDESPVYDNDGKQVFPKNLIEKDDFDQLSPFWQTMSGVIRQSLTETGVAVKSLAVDQNGIVRYEGVKRVGKKGDETPVQGHIGQIFEPNDKEFNEDGTPNLKFGLIETKFNSDDNYYIAPGYTAYVIPPKEDDRPYEERTRLRGYIQQMSAEIKQNLRHDLIADNGYDNTTGLNSVYHHIYGDKRSLNFVEEMTQEGKDASMIKAINDTSMRRVRFDNCYKDGTSILSKVNAEKIAYKPTRGYNMYLDTVRANMAIMDATTSAGIFDPTNTGTGTNQGIVRYLTTDAIVNPDGSITKGSDNSCPLTEHEDFKFLSYNPPDRGIMSLMNAMNQSSTARGRDVNPAGEHIDKIGVGTAHMSLGGYTQDDAFVVSEEFAKMNMIRGSDGNMRPLQIGDKICDHSGNKGVISFAADRNADMSYYEPMPITSDMSERVARKVRAENATKAAQKRVIDVFKDNPTLEVVGAPYTAPSRFNGGTAREMIMSQDAARNAGMPTTLNVEGKSYDGSIGYINWIITDMPVDEKTHIYESDGDGGRKASGQLVWALSELGAKDLIDEIYKYNNEPTIKTREMLIATGLDLSETGEIRTEYTPHMIGVDADGKQIYEQRKEFSTRMIAAENRDEKGNIHRRQYDGKFNELMAEDGGFMRIPFPLKLAANSVTPEKLNDSGEKTGEYMMPILAGKYRSNRETIDNKLMLHEYTNQYRTIYINARQYIEAEEKGDEKAMETAVASAQRAYDAVSNDIIDRQFTGKHNIFKDDIMRKQLQGTATAVISPDPSLDLDEMSMTASTAISLGIDVDDPTANEVPIVAWRDPLLSGGGIRKFRPRIIEDRPGYPGFDIRNPLLSQVGVGINPSSATSFEGDFDGDSMGLYVPQTKAGIKCANDKLSFASQMLNRECNERGQHSAYFQDGLDVAAGLYYDAENGGNIRKQMNEAVALANEVDLHGENFEAGICNKAAFNKFNKAMHDAQNAAFGHDVICYASAEDHIKSLIPMVKSGAKGSPKKLVEGYAPYFGAKFDINENYELINFEDVGAPYVTNAQRQASFAATHAKAYLTGVAGKFSQHAQMMALNASKNDDVFSYSAAATALTHPVTQSVMQLKHDGTQEIMHKIDMIQTVAPALWAGMKIKQVPNSWEVDVDGEGNGVQASPEEWKKSFKAFYEDKYGLNVGTPNPEYVSQMADIMTVNTQDGPRVIGFDTKTKAIMPSEKPLTRLAYECSFSTICNYAKSASHESIFDGNVSRVMAPKVIRENLIEQEKARTAENYVPVYQALKAKDTQFSAKDPIPSVDVMDKMLKEQRNVAEIDGERMHSTYMRMSAEEQTDAMQTFVKKAAIKLYQHESVELTDVEKEICSIYKSQMDVRKRIGENNVAEYEAKHPDAFREIKMYHSLMALEKKKYEKPLDKLPEDDYNAVAKTVVKAYITSQRGVSPSFTDVNANEFNNRLQSQGMRLDKIAVKDRAAYIDAHKSEFRERIACTNVRAEVEALCKQRSARAGINRVANASVSSVDIDDQRRHGDMGE